MKNFLIGLLIFLIVLVIGVGAAFLIGNQYVSNQNNDEIPDHVDIEANELGTVVAVGRGLYDENGDRFEIKGINFGNLFIAEGWMTVNSIGAAYNKDGSFKSVNKEGVVEEYEEIYQEEMDELFANRFSDEQIEALNDAFFNAYCTESDFKLISDTGLNTIRLPLYYRSFLTTHDRYRLSDEQLCDMNFDDIELVFDKVDKFLEYAKQYDLKVILDMHGLMGGQSGYEHCGTRDMDFWENEDYIVFMSDLWRAIAEHYTEERPDLASTVLAYDLANEPTKRNEAGTGALQWRVMDRLYEAIREVDTQHVISIEGVWYPNSLPDPEDYGWENVLYQYHFYNWNHDKGVSNEMFYSAMFTLYTQSDYNVPKFVGEFNFFGNKDAWSKYLVQYDELGWGWTIWSYKIVSVGWWDSSWGLVVNKLDLQNSNDTPIEDYKMKLDLRTASYDEIMAVWSTEETKYNGQDGGYKLYRDGMLYNVLKDYFGEEFKVNNREIER
ncbi:MAG: cellulase family glycosylhydrolase [Clostridia bacterium]|nr:cellulase family glycosylhydrolase [Clostridia bacterium]